MPAIAPFASDDDVPTVEEIGDEVASAVGLTVDLVITLSVEFQI